MALVVEDGSGKTTADAYVSVAYVTMYESNYTASTSFADAVLATQERAIRLATLYLDQTYHRLWRGRRNDQDQSLDWPRIGAYDDNDWLIDNDIIPDALKIACADLALAVVAGDDLDPDLAAGSATIGEKSEKLAVLSRTIKYIGGAREFKEYTRVKRQLAGLTQQPGRLHRG